MFTFAQFNLNKNIYNAIQACGYTNPTPVQQRSIPEILNGRDLVASAQTGTGKTASFVLPALHHLALQSSKKTRILILTPTRELAAQITKSANTYGKFLKFNIVSLVGGMPYHHQIRDLSRGADIIVATPGRLIDHLENRRVNLSNIDMLVLDEADRMLDMGFIDDVKYIANLTPAHRQTLLFSATVDNRLDSVIKQLLKNPIRIDLSNEKLSAPKIKQELYKANNAHHKTKMLKHFLNDSNIYKAIIFSATKINADKLADQLRESGLKAAALHGDLRQNVRNRTIEQLRHGKIQFLVATDVAARGIDISDITHVINYDLPKFCEDYVHRIGRTGRAGKSGTAISFVLPSEFNNLKRIERYLGHRIQLIQNVDFASGDDEIHDQSLVVNERKFSDHSKKQHGYRQKFSNDRRPQNQNHHRGRMYKDDYEDEKSNREHRSNEEKKSRHHDKLAESGRRVNRSSQKKSWHGSRQVDTSYVNNKKRNKSLELNHHHSSESDKGAFHRDETQRKVTTQKNKRSFASSSASQKAHVKRRNERQKNFSDRPFTKRKQEK